MIYSNMVKSSQDYVNESISLLDTMIESTKVMFENNLVITEASLKGIWQAFVVKVKETLRRIRLFIKESIQKFSKKVHEKIIDARIKEIDKFIKENNIESSTFPCTVIVHDIKSSVFEEITTFVDWVNSIKKLTDYGNFTISYSDIRQSEGTMETMINHKNLMKRIMASEIKHLTPEEAQNKYYIDITYRLNSTNDIKNVLDETFGKLQDRIDSTLKYNEYAVSELEKVLNSIIKYAPNDSDDSTKKVQMTQELYTNWIKILNMANECCTVYRNILLKGYNENLDLILFYIKENAKKEGHS